MGCLLQLMLLPVYGFLIFFSICIYIIYLIISLIGYIIYRIRAFFTKSDYQYSYKKPEFVYKKIIVNRNNNSNKFENDITKKKKVKVIDAEIEE